MRKKLDTFTVSILILVVFAVFTAKINAVKGHHPLSVSMPVLWKSFGDWKLEEQIDIPEKFLRILGTKTAVLGHYRDNDGNLLQLYILKSSGRRSTIHQPEYCYIGSGKNEILKKGDFKVFAGEKRGEITVNYFIIQIEQGFQIVSYFYTANELITNNYYKQQIVFLLKRLKNKKIEGSLVRLSKIFKKADFEEEKKLMQHAVKSLLMEI